MKLQNSLAWLYAASMLSPLVAARPAPYGDQTPLGEQSSDLRLISVSDVSPPQWLTEDEIFDLIRAKKKFIDVTDGDLSDASLRKPDRIQLPDGPSQKSAVQPLLGNISKDRMTEFLTTFSAFTTRYYKSSSGEASAEWLLGQVEDLATAANEAGRFNVSVARFDHPWTQFSIISRIASADAEKADDGIVIVSAHQDSVNQWNPWWGRSPGADDDGSGTTSTFEAFRVLLESNVTLGRPVEFHWYSAEEGGLLGSQKVAAAYLKNEIAVAGMMQVDMTGYVHPKSKPVVGIATDNVDAKLSAFLQKVSKEYNTIPWKDVKCGYGCSDHASWNKAGYPSSFIMEGPFDESSPYIHTASDDISHIDFDHVEEFSRLALAFAVELSLGRK